VEGFLNVHRGLGEPLWGCSWLAVMCWGPGQGPHFISSRENGSTSLGVWREGKGGARIGKGGMVRFRWKKKGERVRLREDMAGRVHRFESTASSEV